VSHLRIFNGSFNLQASFPWAGIGSGPFSSVLDTVTISGGFFDCSAIDSTFCFNAGSLTFQGGSMSAITNYRTVGPSIQSLISGSPDLYFEYISHSSRESLTGLPILHLESISFPYSTVYSLRIQRESETGVGSERELTFDANRSRGFAFTVDSVGNYSIIFNSLPPESSGRLGHDGVLSFFASDPSDNLYSEVRYYFRTESPHLSATIPLTPTSAKTMTATSSERKTELPAQTPAPSEEQTDVMTVTSSQGLTAAPINTETPTASRRPEPVDPDDSDEDEEGGIKAAIIVVPIVLVAFAVSVTAVVCWYRCRRGKNDRKYQGIAEPGSDNQLVALD
jgi:hypothetical protein